MKSASLNSRRRSQIICTIAASCLPGALFVSMAGPAAAAAPSADAQLRAAWRGAIARIPVPEEGCFKASYPSTEWTKVECITAPARPYVPRRGRSGETVGNGNDYAALTSTLTSSALGSFPVVTGVKSEKGYGGAANTYSLQLNSGFMTTAGCNGSSNKSCLTWQQFVYSSSETSAFMQYWLINYGSKCPAGGGWTQYEGSCYKNSAAVGVPKLPITDLGDLSVSGTAVSGGNDTMILANGSNAYSTSGKDTVVYLATAWDASEFNVVGDGGGSEAKFNKGSSITVNIGLKDGTSSAPTCKGDDGTTGETNNLTLGSCTASGGSTPSVEFTEKN